MSKWILTKLAYTVYVIASPRVLNNETRIEKRHIWTWFLPMWQVFTILLSPELVFHLIILTQEKINIQFNSGFPGWQNFYLVELLKLKLSLKSSSFQSDLKLNKKRERKKREREKKKRKKEGEGKKEKKRKKKRERDFKYLLTLIVTGWSLVTLINPIFS